MPLPLLSPPDPAVNESLQQDRWSGPYSGPGMDAQFPVYPSAGLDFMDDLVNPITNPSFEVNTTGWSVTGTTMARSSTVIAASGDWTLRVDPGNGDTYASITVNPVTWNLRSKAVVLSAYVFVPAALTYGAGQTRCLYITDGTTTVTTGNYSTLASLPLGRMFRVILDPLTVAAGATTITIRLYNGASAGVAYYDAVQLDTTTLQPYYDGDSPGARWTGTAHASEPRRVSNPTTKMPAMVPRVNLHPNPSAEVNLGNWNSAASLANSITRSSTRAYSGTYSVRQTVASTGGAYIGQYVGLISNAGTAGASASPGVIYTGSCFAYLPSFAQAIAFAPYGVTARLVFYTAAGALISSADGTGLITGAAQWIRPKVTATAPAATAFVALMVWFYTEINQSVDWYLDGAMIEPGVSTPSTYFDGDNIGSYWLPFAHGSASFVRVADTAKPEPDWAITLDNNDMSEFTSADSLIVPTRMHARA